MTKTFLKILSFILIIACISCIFAGCGKSASLQGKWYDESSGKLVLTLNANGTGTLLGYSGKYTVNSSYINLKLEHTTVKIYYEKINAKKLKIQSYIDGDNIGNLTLVKK